MPSPKPYQVVHHPAPERYVNHEATLHGVAAVTNEQQISEAALLLGPRGQPKKFCFTLTWKDLALLRDLIDELLRFQKAREESCN